MKGSGRAAPNGRDKGRYGANRQVRASANARKWKGMIEYVTIFMLQIKHDYQLVCHAINNAL
jgi:hypothetical protein